MKLRLMLALFAMLVAVTLPGLAEAHFRGGFGGGFHGFHGGGFGGGFHGFHGGGFGGFHGGFRGFGFFPGYSPGYYSGYYDPCWRWVRWPYLHRAYVCY